MKADVLFCKEWIRTGNKACFAESTSQCVADRLFQLQSLQSENTSLRRQVTTNIYQIPSGSDYPDPCSPSALKRRQSARASRPMSMYETGSGLKPYLPKGETPYPEEGIPTLQPFPPHVSKTCSLLSFAVSSPLPCFHDFPSCFHPVCKPFSLPFLKKCFSILICHWVVFCSVKDKVIKKHNAMHLDTASLISSCPDTYSKPLSAYICCLLECCLFVRRNARRCCFYDIL